jgi:predicted ester cyclase
MDNCEIVRRFTEEAWGKGDLGVVDELVAPDAVPPHGSEVSGPRAYKQEIMQIRDGLADYETVVEDVFGVGDRVAIRWRTTGRHTGPLFGFAPTGRSVCIPGVDIFRVVDGKIVEHWGEEAMPSLLGQIGAFSPPAPVEA